MSIATNETDKAVGGILQSLQEVTPEIAAQAVVYWRMVDMVWLGILGAIMLVCTVLCVWGWRKWKEADYYSDSGYAPTTVASGIAGGLALAAGCAVAFDLMQTYVAADYYAAQCILNMMN